MSTQKKTAIVNILILLAILAVAAAVAIPAYCTHRTRQHVTEALQAADAAQLVVMEAATTQGGLVKVKASELVYNPRSVTNPYVASMSIVDGGRITIITRGTGGTPDPVVLLTPSEPASPQGYAPIVWTCSVLSGEVSAVPPNCRGSATAAISTAAPAASGSR